MQKTNFSLRGVQKHSLMFLSFILVSFVSASAFSSGGGGFNNFLDKALNAAEKYADKKSNHSTQNQNNKPSNQFAQGQNNQYYQGGQYPQGQVYPYPQGQGSPYQNQFPQAGQYPQGMPVQGQGSPYQTQYPQYPQDPNNPFPGQYSPQYYNQYGQGQNVPYPGLLPPGYSQPPQIDPYTGQPLPGYPYPYPPQPQCQCAPANNNQFMNKQDPRQNRFHDRNSPNQNHYQNDKRGYNRNGSAVDQTDSYSDNGWNNDNFEDDIDYSDE